MVGAAAVEVLMVLVLVAWSRHVSGCPGGLGLCVLLVFVVVDAGVVLGLEASDQEGSDGGFATQCPDAVLGLGELQGGLAEVDFGGRELAGGSVGVGETAQLGEIDEDLHRATLMMVRKVGDLPGIRDMTNHMTGIARVL